MASYNHFNTPNSRIPDCTNSGRAGTLDGSPSLHRRGQHAVLRRPRAVHQGEGQRHFMGAIATRAGGEVISSSDY